MPKTSRNVRKVGNAYLLPGGLLTTEQCQTVAGLGRLSLIEARRDGVKPITRGKRDYYRTEDLIAWLKSDSKAK